MSKGGSTVLTLGIVFVIAGTTFALQGEGLVGGSFMSGNPFWIYAGSGIALFGVAVAALGYIMRKGPPAKKS